MTRDLNWNYGSFDAILDKHAQESQAKFERPQQTDATDVMSRVQAQQEIVEQRTRAEAQQDKRPHFFGIPVAAAAPKKDGTDTFFANIKQSKLGDLWGGKPVEPHAGTVWGSVHKVEPVNNFFGHTENSGNSFWGGSAGSFWGHKNDDSNNGGGGGLGW